MESCAYWVGTFNLHDENYLSAKFQRIQLKTNFHKDFARSFVEQDHNVASKANLQRITLTLNISFIASAHLFCLDCISLHKEQKQCPPGNLYFSNYYGVLSLWWPDEVSDHQISQYHDKKSDKGASTKFLWWTKYVFDKVCENNPLFIQ